MMLEEYCLDKYELSFYAKAGRRIKALKMERDFVVDSLYEDISPSITGFDYDAGRMFVSTTHTESMALEIIDTKARYQKLIEKEERKALFFELGMESLTDRERDVIRVHYLDHENNLGLSESYFSDVLKAAQSKLCLFIGNKKFDSIQERKEKRKETLRQQVQASGF